MFTVLFCPEEMILTDADFGRAYLVESEGWARRFLVELFRSFTILFVGYSHDDTIMNYLARALPASEKAKRFALTKDNKNSYKKWQILGIESITYHSSHSRTIVFFTKVLLNLLNIQDGVSPPGRFLRKKVLFTLVKRKKIFLTKHFLIQLRRTYSRK